MALEKVGVRAIIEGVSAYVRDANRIDRSTASMGRGVKGVASNFRVSTTQALRFGAALVGVQLGISVMSRTIIGLQRSTVGAAIAFESSFAGIRKTMSLTEEEFERLARANRDLAKEIPVTVNELNRIGELAGQLGIRGVANVIEFEDTIAKLAVTTNLTAEAAAISLAQFANILQIPRDQVDNLGSAIVGLGNNFETVESKIVDFGQRIAGAGKIAGLTAGDIFGIGTAFASVGVEAERGGTAIQQSLIKMQQAVNEGGNELDIFAAVADTTAEEFAELFREDAAEAFIRFVEGLGDVGEQGFQVLDALGMSGQRLIGSFLSVAGAGDTLREAIAQGNREFNENVALQKEAEQRFETTASKLRLLRNGFADIGIEAGDASLFGLEPLLDATQEWIDTNGDEFALDLADAIAGGIDFARELADEIGRLAAFLQEMSETGPVKIALDVVDLTGKDKLVLTLAAAVLGGLTFGPQGALVLGGVTLAGLTVADLFDRGETAGERRVRESEERETQQIVDAVLADVAARFRVDIAIVEKAFQARALLFTEAGFGPSAEALELFQATRGRPAQPFDIDAIIGTILGQFGAVQLGPRAPELTPLGPAVPEDEDRVIPPGLFVDPEDAAREEAKRKRALERLQADAERVRAQLRREQISELDTFGDLLIDALRGRAQRELDVTEDALDEEREARQRANGARLEQIADERDAAIDAISEERSARRQANRARREEIADERDAAIDAITDRRDAELAALRDETDARIAALNEELGLLSDETDAEERELLERELALAFDANDRAEIERRIREFDRDERRQAIREEIGDVRDASRDRATELRERADSEVRIARDRADEQERIERDAFEAAVAMFDRRLEAARDHAEEQTQIERDAFDEDIRILDARGDAARMTFEQITSDWALESEARRLLMEEENEAIVALLEEQGDSWQTAGISFGESLVGGIRSELDPFLSDIFNTIRGIGASTVTTAAPLPGSENVSAEDQNTAGVALSALGTPERVLASMRAAVLAQGGIPEFPHGGIVSGSGRRIPIIVEPGELILNPSQQAAIFGSGGGGGTTFERGAFDGMFRGATLTGTVDENRRMVRMAIEEVLDDQLGHGALVAGVNQDRR